MLIESIPYTHIIVGILILIGDFVFHWIGQLISLINWDYATNLGLQEKKLLPEFKVYEHAIATSDVSMGWIYGIVGIGLLINFKWINTFALIPGSVFVYHSLYYRKLIGNQNASGHPTTANSTRVAWFCLNFIAGILAILIAI